MTELHSLYTSATIYSLYQSEYFVVNAINGAALKHCGSDVKHMKNKKHFQILLTASIKVFMKSEELFETNWHGKMKYLNVLEKYLLGTQVPSVTLRYLFKTDCIRIFAVWFCAILNNTSQTTKQTLAIQQSR